MRPSASAAAASWSPASGPARPLADHRADRRAWDRDLLGLPEDPDADNYLWVQAAPTDPDVLPRENRLLVAIADRSRWRDQLRRALDEARGLTTAPDVSATRSAA